MECNGWSEVDHPPLIDDEKPEYSKYWYVRGQGKQTSWTQNQKKEVQGTSNLKNLAQLQAAGKLMECLGYQEEVKEGSSPIIENVKYTLLMKEVEQCRST